MKTLRLLSLPLMVGCLLASHPDVHAGLPQPAMVLYGQVFEGNELVTAGVLEWSYTDGPGENTTTVNTILRPIAGPGGETYSYSIQIPIELEMPGFDRTANTLSLIPSSRAFLRSARLNGQPIAIDTSTLGASFTLNINQHTGYIERVDLLRSAPGECCPGDADGNRFVNLSDYRPVRESFGDPTPRTGDADCSGFVNTADYRSVRDNFGSDCGSQSLRVFAEAPTGKSARADGSATAILSLVPGIEAPSTDDTFPVYVELSAAAGASLVGVFVQYDPDTLEFIGGAADRTILDSELYTGDPREVAPGLIAFSGGSSATLPAGASIIAELAFIARKPGSTGLDLLHGGSATTEVQTAGFEPLGTTLAGASLRIQSRTSVDDWRLMDQ